MMFPGKLNLVQLKIVIGDDLYTTGNRMGIRMAIHIRDSCLLGFDSIQGLEVNRLTINFGQINQLID
jgi:hypothetical protein